MIILLSMDITSMLQVINKVATGTVQRQILEHNRDSGTRHRGKTWLRRSGQTTPGPVNLHEAAKFHRRIHGLSLKLV